MDLDQMHVAGQTVDTEITRYINCMDLVMAWVWSFVWSIALEIENKIPMFKGNIVRGCVCVKK